MTQMFICINISINNDVYMEKQLKKSFKRLSPIVSSTLIDALGGPTKIASLCNLSRSCVSQWKKNGITDPYVRFLREKFKDEPVMKCEEIRNF